MFLIQMISAILLAAGCMVVFDSMLRLKKKGVADLSNGGFEDIETIETDQMISKISTVLGLVLICTSGSIIMM